MAVIPFHLALALYAAAAACGVWYLRTGSPRAAARAQRLAAVGFGVHTVFLVCWALRHGRLPAYTPFEALAALLWGAVLAYFTVARVPQARALPAFVMPVVACGGLAVALFAAPHAQPASTARSWWLPVHVASSLLGAADFLVGFAVAVMYLVQQRLLKRRAVGRLMQRMPSLETLDQLNYRAVALGLPVFTLALLSGVVLAVAKRPDWWASWLVAASFLAWIVYAVLLHVRLGVGLRGPKVARLTVLGFLLVLAIVCGLVLFGDPLHTMRRHTAHGDRPPTAEVDHDAP